MLSHAMIRDKCVHRNMSATDTTRSIARALHHRRAMRFHKLMTMTAISSLFLSLTAAVRGQSALDGFNPNPNGNIDVVVVQPDGKILLGGRFSTLSPNGSEPVTPQAPESRIANPTAVETAWADEQCRLYGMAPTTFLEVAADLRKNA